MSVFICYCYYFCYSYMLYYNYLYSSILFLYSSYTLLYSTLLFLAAEVAVPSANVRYHVFERLISTLLELQKVVLSAENDLPQF